MPLPQPELLVSAGTYFSIKLMNAGQLTPDEVSINITAAATVGATTLTVAITPSTANTKIYAGTYLLVGTGVTQQWVITAADAVGTATTLTVEPITLAIAANTTVKTYAGLPLIGLEGANLQLQAEVNSAVLLSTTGWQIRDYSTGSWQFSGNLYIPRNSTVATAAETVITGLLNKQNVWVDRVLPNGTYFAGRAMVSDASDQTQGAQYVTLSVTFQGSGAPIYRRLGQ